MLRSWLLVGILGLCPALSLAQDVRPAAKLPVVKSGDMPFYPPLLRTAQVEGEVDLRVTTDGSSVVSATLDYGNLLLVKAAQDNVRTWKFEPHASRPSFRQCSFTIWSKSCTLDSCEPTYSRTAKSFSNSRPEVDITRHLRIPDCHDPNEGLTSRNPCGCSSQAANSMAQRSPAKVRLPAVFGQRGRYAHSVQRLQRDNAS